MSSKEAIIKAAMDIICEEGANKYSLTKVAERAKITKAAIFYHFKNKEELTHTLISHTVKEHSQILCEEYKKLLVEGQQNPYTKAYIISNFRQLNDPNLVGLHRMLLVIAFSNDVNANDWEKVYHTDFFKMKQEIGEEKAELVRLTLNGMWHAKIFQLEGNEKIPEESINQLLQRLIIT